MGRSVSHQRPSVGVDPDDTWRALVSTRPSSTRGITQAMPYRLGITSLPAGGWRDYVRQPPMFDLPGYMADRAPRAVSPAALRRYRRAHHCAGFYGLIVDRVEDGQVADSAALRSERAWLRSVWVAQLGQACGSTASAKTEITATMQALRQGASDARTSRTAGALDAEHYAAAVRKRVGFLWVATGLMLRVHGAGEDVIDQARTDFEHIMIALQCCDDAVDDEEDRELFGQSAAASLGVAPSALQATGAMMFEGLRARVHGPLATWCGEMAARAWRSVAPPERLAAGVGALGLVDGMMTTEEVQ